MKKEYRRYLEALKPAAPTEETSKILVSQEPKTDSQAILDLLSRLKECFETMMKTASIAGLQLDLVQKWCLDSKNELDELRKRQTSLYVI